MKYRLIRNNIREIVTEDEEKKFSKFSYYAAKNDIARLKELSVRDIFETIVYNGLLIEFYKKMTVEDALNENASMKKYSKQMKECMVAMFSFERGCEQLIYKIQEKYGMNIFEEARAFVKAKAATRSRSKNELKCKGILARMDALEVEIEMNEGKV